MFFVYVLYSDSHQRYYVGLTETPDERLRAHNSKGVTSTKAFVPWRIVHLEEFISLEIARKREKYLKSAAGRRWRKNNLGM